MPKPIAHIAPITIPAIAPLARPSSDSSPMYSYQSKACII